MIKEKKLLSYFKTDSNLELKNKLYNDPYDQQIKEAIDHRIKNQSTVLFKLRASGFILSIITLVLSFYFSEYFESIHIWLDNLLIFTSLGVGALTINDYFNALSPLDGFVNKVQNPLD